MICQYCNQEFISHHHNQKYCSDKCINNYWNRYYREEYNKKKKTKKCIICGKEFTPFKKQLACSKECKYKRKLEKARIDDRNRIIKYKKEVFKLLGGHCCNPYNIDHIAFELEPDYFDVLQIDHINGGGTKEHKQFRVYRDYFLFVYNKIKSGSNDYQLLCPTCNWLKRWKNKENSQRKS